MGSVRDAARKKTLRLQNGYALIEWVIGITLSFMLFSAYAQSSFAIRSKVETAVETIRLHQEAASFYHYLEREMAGATGVSVGVDRLVFSTSEDWFEYVKVGETIVRKRDGAGYVTVCYFVQAFSIFPVEKGARVRLALKGKLATIEAETVIAFEANSS